MKQQVWLANVKYLWLSLITSWALVFCIDTDVFTISKGKEIFISNKEYVRGHR